MIPEVNLYLDQDNTNYAKDKKNGERKGHITLDILAAGLDYKQLIQLIKKYKLGSIRTTLAVIGLGFSIGLDRLRDDYLVTQKLLDWMFKEFDDEDAEKMLEIGARGSFVKEERTELKNKIYPMDELIVRYSNLNINVNYISIEPPKLQKIIAGKSGVDVKQFYQTRSIRQKVYYVKALAEKNPNSTYILIDDKIEPKTYNNLILLDDIRNLPAKLENLNGAQKFPSGQLVTARASLPEGNR